MQAILALEDGRIFSGIGHGAKGECYGEVVFNTSITGYQEIFTDPSYAGQIVVLTNPQIGNYGTNPDDNEATHPYIEGLIVREFSPISSNWRSQQVTDEYLEKFKIPVIADIDTRALVRHLRTHGVMRGVISSIEADRDKLIAKARALPKMDGTDLAKVVTTKQRYQWDTGTRSHEPTEVVGVKDLPPSKHVVAYDFGIKQNILRMLVDQGCRVTVVPAMTSAEDVMSLNPDGVFLSNGPGDPEPCTYAADNIRRLMGKTPIFGICLGHQLVGLALGGKTYKLKFGHHGGNHPVKQLETGKIEITAHNHNFAVDPDSLKDSEILKTHIDLNDNTLEGLRHRTLPLFTVQSHPEALMTKPERAARTYIEPLTKTYLEEIIRQESEMLRGQPGKFALLPTVGGQTALNLAVELADSGILEKYNVELIGAQLRAIKMAEDRLLFKDAMTRIGLDVPKSALVNNLKDGLDFSGKIGFPLIIRPSFTLGGSGGGIAYNREELLEILARGLDLSPVHEVLIEESVLGWKEYELEVMRDTKDNVIIVCSIENFDPMGVHTGDSITVAPAQTLTDREYQRMRDAAIRVIREIGVETGGSNVQFAVNPLNGRMTVIEMNPRVSRSSALASKATGFPIAKIAARLAVGYTLDEIQNDITKATPACFEPTIDYVVGKIPKWQFEKFPGADTTLGTQMKSVGEVMAIGRTFKEALQKGIRSLEPHTPWRAPADAPDSLLREKLSTPRPDRIHWLLTAVERGLHAEEICELTKIDPWFIHQ